MRRRRSLLGLLAGVGLLAPGATGKAAVDHWTAVARAPAEAAAGELRAADEALAAARAAGGGGGGHGGGAGGGGEAAAERHLREAVRYAPASFEAWQALAELLAAMGRPRDAIAAATTARRFATTPVAEARAWFRIGVEESRLGAYARSLDAYERALGGGAELDSAAAGNSAEMLMAEGRLDEAIARYREAVAIEEQATDRRGHSQSLALAYFGLAVALDRADRPAAAREAVGRAVALDRGLATLQLALVGSGDVSFLPPADVYYYLGLAREAVGRIDEARAAYREYLERATAADRYTARARDHLAALRPGDVPPARGPGGPSPSPRARRARWRVASEATVEARGPVVAPLIDAAWRLDPAMLDGCLAEAQGELPRLRLSLDIEIDERGRVRRAAARAAPPGLAEGVVRCIEQAIVGRLRVAPPARRKPTRARIELVLAPEEASAL